MTAPSLCSCPACRNTNPDKVNHKICEQQVQEICNDLIKQERLKEKWRQYSNPELAKKYGVSQSSIEYIKRNKLGFYAEMFQ